MSSDRLFRVRSKQPYASESTCRKEKVCKSSVEPSKVPIVSQEIKLGELCVFKESIDNWSIGRVLQFARHKEKGTSHQQHKGFSVNVSKKDVGVLCSWFELQEGSSTVFKTGENKSNVIHSYHPISSYLCTLTSSCLQVKKCCSTADTTSVMLKNL